MLEAISAISICVYILYHQTRSNVLSRLLSFSRSEWSTREAITFNYAPHAAASECLQFMTAVRCENLVRNHLPPQPLHVSCILRAFLRAMCVFMCGNLACRLRDCNFTNLLLVCTSENKHTQHFEEDWAVYFLRSVCVDCSVRKHK